MLRNKAEFLEVALGEARGQAEGGREHKNVTLLSRISDDPTRPFRSRGKPLRRVLRVSGFTASVAVVSLAVTAMVIIAASVSTAGFPIMAMAMAMAAAREMPSAVAAVPAAAMYRIPKAQIFRPLSFPLTAGSAAPLTTHLALISGRS